MKKNVSIVSAFVVVCFAMLFAVACSAQAPTLDEPGKACDSAAVGAKCTTEKLLCSSNPSIICFCGAFVTREEYETFQRIGAKCAENPAAAPAPAAPAPAADAGPDCAATKPCSLLSVKCIDASSRILVCTPCGWVPETMTCPIGSTVDAGSCALNGMACTDVAEGTVATSCAPPWVCCKQPNGVKLWVAGATCPSVPADTGVSTDAGADSGSSPADTGTVADSSTPADTGATDTGTVDATDTSSSADSGTADSSFPPADTGVSDTALVFDTYKWEFPKGYVQTGEVRIRWYTGITALPWVMTKVSDAGPVEGGTVYECKVFVSPSSSPTFQGEHMDTKCPVQSDGTRFCYAFDQSCAWYGGGCDYYKVVGKNFGTISVKRGSVTSECIVRTGTPKAAECRLVPNGSVSTSFNAVVEPTS